MEVKPIGFISSPFTYKNGTPRQPTICPYARGSLTIEKSVFNNPQHSLEGLEQFSHVWLIFVFHKNNSQYIKAKVKPPRLNGKRVGLFSTRSPYRPNAIGLTLAKLESIAGSTLYLTGIDLLDGTPILDIKPYIPDYDMPRSPIKLSSPDQGTKETYEHQDSMSQFPAQYFAESQEEAGVQKDYISFEGRTSSDFERKMDHFPTNDIDSSILKVTDSDLLSQRNDTGTSSSEKNDRLKNCEHVIGSDKSSVSKYGNFVNDESLNCCECEDLAGQLTSVDVEGTVAGNENTSHQLTSVNKLGDLVKSLGDSVDVGSMKSSLLVVDDSSLIDSSVKSAEWISNSPVSKLGVIFTERAKAELNKFCDSDGSEYSLKFLRSCDEALEAIESILREDPRSVYRRQKCVDSLYYFTVDTLHVTCWFDIDLVEVVRIQPVSQCYHLNSK